jgi:hypothetical protein
MFTREELISRDKITSTRGHSQYEKDFLKTLLAMPEMVKVLYEHYLE